jgi:phosphinothricin acetyltransferase
MTAEQTIRLASHADLPAIVEIYNHAVEDRNATGDLEPRTLADQEAWFAAHPPDAYPVYVHEREGVVRGWCSISAYRPGRRATADVGEVSYYVDREHRGQGVGTGLLAHALAHARRIGKRVLFAIVIEGNTGSLALLAKHGFRQWGFLPDVVDIEGVIKGHVYLGRGT